MTSILNPMVTQECTDPGAFRRETAEACTGAALLSSACRDTIVRSAATHGAQCMRMPIFDGGPPFQAYVCRGADRASGLLGGQCDQPATRVAPSAVAPSTSSSGVAPVELGALGTAGLVALGLAGHRAYHSFGDDSINQCSSPYECGFEPENAFVVLRDTSNPDKVLVVQQARANRRLKNSQGIDVHKWMLPGGRIDHPGKSGLGHAPDAWPMDRNAAIRETQEESGFNIAESNLHLSRMHDSDSRKAAIFEGHFDFGSLGDTGRDQIFQTRDTKHETRDYGFATMREGRLVVESYSGELKDNGTGDHVFRGGTPGPLRRALASHMEARTTTRRVSTLAAGA